MATVILGGIVGSLTGATAATAAGTALTGAQIFWGTLATVAGAYIDQTLILPRLFNKPGGDESEGPEVQSIDEGSPHRYSIGPEARVPGFLAWQPRELTFVRGEEPGKGGGAGKGQGSVDKYYTDGVWLFTRVPTELDGIVTFSKVWMDAKIRYDDEAQPLLEVESSLYNIQERIIYGGGALGSREISALEYTVVGQTNLAPSLSDFRTTRIRVSGCADSRLDTPEDGAGSGGWEVTLVAVTGDDLPVLSFTIPGGYFKVEYQQSNQTYERPINEGDLTAGDWVGDLTPGGSPLTLRQSQDKFDQGLFSNISFRTGTRNHSGYSYLEAEENVAPKWYNFSAIGIESMLLADFGTRLPNLEALVVADQDPVPLGQALSRILEYYLKLDPDKFDVSRIGPGVVRGYWWQAPASGFDVLGPLLLAYDIIVYEVAGVAIFASRDQLDVITVPETDLGGTKGTKPADAPTLLVSEETVYDATKSVNIRYTDPDSVYQTGDMVFTRPDLEFGSSTTLDLTRLTLTAQEARDIANRALWQSASFTRELEFVLPPKYLGITAGTVVETTSFGRDWRIVVTDVARGRDGRIVCSGYEDVGTIEDLPSIATDNSGSSGGGAGFYLPPKMLFQNAQCPAIPGVQASSPVTLLAAAAINPFSDYRGASLYRGSEQTGAFEFVEQVGREAAIGSLLNDMPDGVPDVPNRYTSNFGVQLSQGELEIVTESGQLVARENLMYCNGEIFSFRSASIDPLYPAVPDGGKYNILGSADVYRGLYGTESKIAAHKEGDTVLLLEENRFEEISVEIPDIGQPFDYRLPAAGDDVLEGATGRTEALNPENVRPYTPSHLRGSKFANVNNLPPYFEIGGNSWAVGDVVQNQGLAWICIQAYDTLVVTTAEPGVGVDYEDYWEELPSADILIRWNRRARTDINILPATPSPLFEPRELYELVIYQGTTSNIARTITPIDAQTQYIYSLAMQETDGNLNTAFNAKVRQLGVYLNSEWNEQELPNG